MRIEVYSSRIETIEEYEEKFERGALLFFLGSTVVLLVTNSNNGFALATFLGLCSALLFGTVLDIALFKRGIVSKVGTVVLVFHFVNLVYSASVFIDMQRGDSIPFNSLYTFIVSVIIVSLMLLLTQCILTKVLK